MPRRESASAPRQPLLSTLFMLSNSSPPLTLLLFSPPSSHPPSPLLLSPFSSLLLLPLTLLLSSLLSPFSSLLLSSLLSPFFSPQDYEEEVSKRHLKMAYRRHAGAERGAWRQNMAQPLGKFLRLRASGPYLLTSRTSLSSTLLLCLVPRLFFICLSTWGFGEERSDAIG